MRDDNTPAFSDPISGERILLVDDQPTHLHVLFKALDGCTYNLLKAAGVKKTLSINRKANSDLVLRDIMMLGVAYYAVCRR